MYQQQNTTISNLRQALTSYPVIAVDLNNTIMHQIGGIVRASKGRLSLSDFDEWDKDLSYKMGMNREQYLQWAWANPYSEMLSEPFTGASQVLMQLKKSGHKIWIVTASVMSRSDIAGWLGCHGIVYDRIIKTSDKRGIGDILIDDSPITCQKFYDEGLPILRYELAWNSHLKHMEGIGWQ